MLGKLQSCSDKECFVLETLEKYKNALLTSIQSQDELQEQINMQKVPETMEKYRECKEAETRLKEVERKLGEWHIRL